MSEEAQMSEEYARYNKWYYWDRFPLLPIIRIKKADKHNEWSFSFRWLVFIFWTITSPNIGFEIKLDDQNFMARVWLPYLILMVCIPIFPYKFSQKLWRYPRNKA